MINFTQQEKQVILFFLSIALIGLAVSSFIKNLSPAKTPLSLTENIGKVNINKAGKELFIEIPGIGKKLAQRIIDYRREHGLFKDIGELKNIKGINGYKYEKIKDFFVLDSQ
jgi:competence ComEA-like helix-hairpin-helix protein